MGRRTMGTWSFRLHLSVAIPSVGSWTLSAVSPVLQRKAHAYRRLGRWIRSTRPRPRPRSPRRPSPWQRRPPLTRPATRPAQHSSSALRRPWRPPSLMARRPSYAPHRPCRSRRPMTPTLRACRNGRLQRYGRKTWRRCSPLHLPPTRRQARHERHEQATVRLLSRSPRRPSPPPPLPSLLPPPLPLQPWQLQPPRALLARLLAPAVPLLVSCGCKRLV